MNCKICATPTSPFISFGKMPIANGFLKESEFKDEYFYNLAVAFCPKCYMVQLTEQPDREKMFHENYAFYSSTSKAMAEHFEKFAKDVMEKYKPEFVVEIGSNDGIMLKHFACRRLGIEPSHNVAEVAFNQGIDTWVSWFCENLANMIVDVHGQADVILAANVMCHISDIHSVIRGVKKLLKPNGVLIFEDPYLGDILEKVSYDQIYDEHAFYFSAKSVNNLMRQYGMEIFDAEPQVTHGGSMRYFIGRHGKNHITGRLHTLFSNEDYAKLDNIETYNKFAHKIEKSRINLFNLLSDLKSKVMKIVGYGATSKSTTITNYCGITPDLVECIYDTTPIKQGKFSPGAHIPIKPYTPNWHEGVDYAVLFAWNHAKEIMEKEKEFKGKWIVYVPEVKIIDSIS